jgi:hypothetical protein
MIGAEVVGGGFGNGEGRGERAHLMWTSEKFVFEMTHKISLKLGKWFLAQSEI